MTWRWEDLKWDGAYWPEINTGKDMFMAKLTLYPSDELHARLIQLAERERRSVSQQTIMLLESVLPEPELAITDTETGASFKVSGVRAKRAAPSGVAGKVRNYPCVHRVPAGAFCKTCDSEEAT